MTDGYERYLEGLRLLAEGHYREGFALYEERRGGARPVLNPRTQWPSLACPEWLGEDVRGKHLLVFGEQGFGDQIMFARFIRALQARGASATYVCGAALERLFPNGHVARRKDDFPPAHYWALSGSLPLRLGITLQSVPEPYPIRLNHHAGGGVGVVPSGRPTHENDAHRSLDAHSTRRLLALGRDLRPSATGARDFADTAEIIAGLDLVISVDTAIAHLAASMGKPTWILLPAHGVDWRWLRDRGNSPWYPSVCLYRQLSNWSETLSCVEAELARSELSENHDQAARAARAAAATTIAAAAAAGTSEVGVG